MIAASAARRYSTDEEGFRLIIDMIPGLVYTLSPARSAYDCCSVARVAWRAARTRGRLAGSASNCASSGSAYRSSSCSVPLKSSGVMREADSSARASSSACYEAWMSAMSATSWM